MGDGPVAPLYLNREEATQLHIAVNLMLRLSTHMVSEETMTLATEVIRWKEGDGAVGRLDRTLASARDRVPVLRSLLTALSELAEQLQREGQ